MKWNSSQRQAIEIRNNNILVSAAAGSGKTAVLVERIIKRILDPHDPLDLEKVLMVTYTEAAAGEMRQRIGKALQKELSENRESQFLRQQLALLNKASISTIHSFCLKLIRKYFYELGLEPGFKVADTNEIVLMRLEIMDEIFEANFSQGEEWFQQLVDGYGGKNGEKLRNVILSLYDYARSQPRPWDWLEGLAGNFSQDNQSLDSLPWIKEIKQDMVNVMDEAVWLLRQAEITCNLPNGPYQYEEIIVEEIKYLISLRNNILNSSWQQLWSDFQALSFKDLPRKKAPEVSDDAKKLAQDLRNKAKKKVLGLVEQYFARLPEDHIRDITVLRPSIDKIVTLVKEFAAAFEKVKREQGLLDFSDLEQICLQLLLDEHDQPTEIARSVSNQYEEIMVDEYQDANRVQNAILETISRQQDGGYMFMVGDVKQSIYRFRLAEPELFIGKEQEYTNREVEKRSGELIKLNTNYRSRSNVIEGINFIFQQLFDKETTELDYSGAFLQYGDLYPSASSDRCCLNEVPIELHLLNRDEDDQMSGQELEEWQNIESLEKEAAVTASRIQKMVEGDEHQDPVTVWDRDVQSYRNITYRDIVVLLRSTKFRANKILEVFKKWNIPVFADINSGYFGAPEVETMIALLEVVDNSQQDIPLAAVLRSPLVGLTGEELAKIRLVNMQADFYQAVCDVAEKSDDEQLKVKLVAFLQHLNSWRTMARREPLSKLIWSIYKQTNFLEFNVGLPEGRQRQANLIALYDRACQFDHFVFQGLFRFLRFIKKLKESEGDLGTARALSENENVVRIMSIHKSKGLEFPVVIAMDLGKQFNLQDAQGDLLFHQHAGLGLKLIDSTTRLRYPTLSQKAVRQRLKNENLSEEMRILYVALTRAQEQLILVGSVRNPRQWRKELQSLCSYKEVLLPSFFRLTASSYLDWICGALVRHTDGHKLLESNQTSYGNQRIREHCSNWSVFFWEHQDLFNLNERPNKSTIKARELDNILEAEVNKDHEDYVRLNSVLSWEYPFQPVVNKAAKLSVTELKRRKIFNPEEDTVENSFYGSTFKRPRFVQKESISAMERGSAIHLIMQHVDLYAPVTEDSIKRQLASMVDKELLTQELAGVIPVGKVVNFFKTALGGQLIASPGKVMREVPFTLGLPAGEIYRGLVEDKAEEKVLVQGIIDCCLRKSSGLVLIDFKTDKVPSEKIIHTKDKYKLQLDIYARALTGIFSLPVVSKYLYFFYCEQLTEVE